MRKVKQIEFKQIRMKQSVEFYYVDVSLELLDNRESKKEILWKKLRKRKNERDARKVIVPFL